MPRADGGPFHDLDLRTGRWNTRHPCAADFYDQEFTVVSQDEWHLRWRVSGPAKTQLPTSVHRRIPPVGRDAGTKSPRRCRYRVSTVRGRTRSPRCSRRAAGGYGGAVCAGARRPHL
ncbi:DUF6314 family protein [Embleya hyalina]|uniref:DUF6314 family protein n=1 Tax=Embleya hyalina TaxID=516124 RepID=UPI0027D98F24|nr:DUF6314 family protein [Embleya hyalina]